MAEMIPGSDAMNALQAASYLGVHVETLRQLARRNAIPSFKVGRDWRFRKAELQAWIEQQRSNGQQAPIPTVDHGTAASSDQGRPVGHGPAIADSLDAVRRHMAGHGHQVGAPNNAAEDHNLAVRILSSVADPDNLRGLIQTVTLCLQKWLGCDAVGVRLRKGLDFPYYETRGFSSEFVLAESSLCERDSMNELVRDSEGHPVLECMCGNIVSGRFDPAKSFFTELGTFWTNSTTELLANTTEEDRQARTRNRCNGEGYESVALFPLKTGSEIHGLLQINDRRKDLFDSKSIALLEQVAVSIAFAVTQKQARSTTADDRSGHGLDGRNGLVVAGRSVVPADASPSGQTQALVLELALNSTTHRVIAISCHGLPNFAREMLTGLLVGKTLPRAFHDARAGLTNGYHSELRTPLLAALDDVLRNYRESCKPVDPRSEDTPCSVLVIDDDEKVGKALCRMLTRMGCQARQASGGSEGLALVSQQVPDLILLDLQMPEMDGPQFLEKLRKAHPDLPVVIVTGYPDGELMQQATQFAPLLLLAKPVDAGLLERTVRTALAEKMSAMRSAGHVGHMPNGTREASL